MQVSLTLRNVVLLQVHLTQISISIEFFQIVTRKQIKWCIRSQNTVATMRLALCYP